MTTAIGVSLYGDAVEDRLAIAAAVEDSGFSSIWLGEHLVAPVSYTTVSPHRPDEVIVPLSHDLSDSFVMCAALLAATRSVVVSTGVYVAPLRHPLLSAVGAITLARMFPGRFRFGLGSGWLAEEFEALGQVFEHRGKRLDEIIEILRLAAMGGSAAHAGEFYEYPELQVTQRPVSIPVISSGVSQASLRRAARYADGWYNPGTMEFEDCLEFRRAIDEYRVEFRTSHRPFQYFIRMQGQPSFAKLERYRDAGFDELVVTPYEVWGHGPVPRDVKLRVIGEIAHEFRLDREPDTDPSV